MNNAIKHPQAGVTLVELILSIVVISIALVGIFKVMNLTSDTPISGEFNMILF